MICIAKILAALGFVMGTIGIAGGVLLVVAYLHDRLPAFREARMQDKYRPRSGGERCRARREDFQTTSGESRRSHTGT